jgi:hypothetical protein
MFEIGQSYERVFSATGNCLALITGLVSGTATAVGLFLPPDLLFTPVSPATYLAGELTQEGQFTILISQVALSSAIVYAVYADHTEGITLGAIYTAVLPEHLTDLWSIPVLNLRVLREVPEPVDPPIGLSLLVSAILLNAGELLRSNHTEFEQQDALGRPQLLPYLEHARWLVVSRVAGYLLVLSCVLSVLFADTPEYIWLGAFPPLVIATYTFVSTDSTRGTAGLATGAWIVGFATLQYDTALTGIAFPTATLLTISAVALWLSKRTDEMSQNISNYNYD